MFGVKILKIFNLKHSNRKMLKTTKDPCSLQDFSARLAMALFPHFQAEAGVAATRTDQATQSHRQRDEANQHIAIFQRNRKDEDKICIVNVAKHSNACKKRNARVAAKLIDPGLHRIA